MELHICPHCHEALDEEGEQEIAKNKALLTLAKMMYQHYKVKDHFWLYIAISIAVYLIVDTILVKLFPADVGSVALYSGIPAMISGVVFILFENKKTKRLKQQFKNDHPEMFSLLFNNT